MTLREETNQQTENKLENKRNIHSLPWTISSWSESDVSGVQGTPGHKDRIHPGGKQVKLHSSDLLPLETCHADACSGNHYWC